jgi:hypothetical protein
VFYFTPAVSTPGVFFEIKMVMHIDKKYSVMLAILTILFVIKSQAENYRHGSADVGEGINFREDSTTPQNALVNSRRTAFEMGDSLLPFLDIDYGNQKYIAELSDLETDYHKTTDNTRTLVHLLRMVRVKKLFKDKNNYKRLLIDLAKVSARLKLYPLAMASYFESESYNEDNTGPGNDFFVDDGTVLSGVDTTATRRAEVENQESQPVDVYNILESFDDRKLAARYAVIILVKQPVSGKANAFTRLNNVGHMFITLIKYNEDHTAVTRSFGFYPDKINKSNTFSATPIDPVALSVFKDDSAHNWDEAIGKFISAKRFEKILKLLLRYDQKPYNLNQNNCTDFGLHVAGIGGINIFATKGKWPLGSGNNPGSAGQSILQNKLVNTDLENKAGLFICVAKNLGRN